MNQLLDIMNLTGGPVEIERVTRTTDGHYLAQAKGDIGYNVFLGRPGPQPFSARKWAGLSDANKRSVVAQAQAWGIDLGDFGITAAL